MSIISRFKDIMSANINALLDKCEDPAKMIDEYMRQVTEQLAEVKKETAGVMAEEKRAKSLLNENNEKIEKYDQLARKALTAGNEDDAKTFLIKKQEYVTTGAELQKAYDIAHSNAQKMREMHDKLTKDVQLLEQRRKTIKAKVSVAKTQEKINKVTGSMDTASSSMKAFERMEEKADRMLNEANSMAELNAEPVDEAVSLEAKYESMANEANVDAELEKLKKEMGL
jgi:phage shock protein A